MKKRNILLASVALSLGAIACSLDSEMYQYKDSDEAFTAVKDVESGMNGAYYALGHYGFLGNYAVAIGDMSGGVCVGSRSSGHFYNVSSYIISETTSELEYVWAYGYKVIDRATRTINGAEAMEADLHSADDRNTVNSYVGQCYAMRALASYYLVNLFALPYSAGTENPGIVLVTDKPKEAMEQVTRSTVGKTYEQILDDIEQAEDLIGRASEYESEEDYYYACPGTSVFYMNLGAVKALKTRVYLSMGRYSDAKQAALDAIAWMGRGDGTGDDASLTDEAYLAMWGSISEEKNEEIFSIKKTVDDNLSANSLNTLYGSYYGSVTWVALDLYGDNDIRGELFAYNRSAGYQPQKYPGIDGAEAVSNIRIFRKSEMSLALAEIYAREDNISDAQQYLLYTAKRDADYALPSTKDDLLAFISEERIREFCGEGHCFYDARRMGDLVSSDTWRNFDIQKFVFPLPASEVTAIGGASQNEGWENNLPE